MTIAFVSDAIYPYNKGGKEKRLFEISTRLAKSGHDVHIYCMQWWNGSNDRLEHGVHLHAIGKLHPLYTNNRRSIKEGILFGLACSRLITKHFDIVDVDHMPFFPLYSVWLVCLLKRKPMFATWNEVWGRKYWVEYMGLGGNIAAVIERVSVHLPNKIVSVSQHTAKRMDKLLHRKKGIFVIPNGINLKEIKAIKASKDKTDIIFAGRLLKHKNVDVLIKAVAELRNTREVSCVIIGKGPEKARLIKLTHKLGVDSQVSFREFYEKHRDLYAHMKASKVFASPSSREGFGIVAIEANACGVPVVTSLAVNNATRELIQHGSNGFLFDSNVESLVGALKIALDSGNSLKRKCQNIAKDFDWNLIAKNMIKVYAL